MTNDTPAGRVDQPVTKQTVIKAAYGALAHQFTDKRIADTQQFKETLMRVFKTDFEADDLWVDLPIPNGDQGAGQYTYRLRPYRGDEFAVTLSRYGGESIEVFAMNDYGYEFRVHNLETLGGALLALSHPPPAQPSIAENLTAALRAIIREVVIEECNR